MNRYRRGLAQAFAATGFQPPPEPPDRLNELVREYMASDVPFGSAAMLARAELGLPLPPAYHCFECNPGVVG